MDELALVPEPNVDALVADAVEQALHAANIPAICRPTPRRVDMDDPALLGFPPTLPLELALGEIPRNEILTAYRLTPESWEELRKNPVFQKAVRDAIELLQRDGMSFRVKARMQSEALLETSWKIIHSTQTPSAVKADLIKHTHRIAGFEPKNNEVGAGNNLQININLG
jgi:hypothetical protein